MPRRAPAATGLTRLTRRLRRTIPGRLALGGAALVAGIAVAGCGHARTGLGASTSRVAGFQQVAFRVRPSSQSGAPGAAHCALLASTPAQRAQGLMFRRDLAGYAGMLFRWPGPTTEEFYMKDTVIPLSIAWFDGSGRYVSSTDMVPCPPGGACPLYAAAGPYTTALEVPRGGLAGLGVGPGALLSLTGHCP